MTDERLRRVTEYIEKHLDADLSVGKLAQVAHFSAYHFHRQFSAHAGISVAKLVRELRMRRAAYALIGDARRTVLTIALESGYESAEAFSRAFSACFGVSPSAFRQAPDWARLRGLGLAGVRSSVMNTDVALVTFPPTRVAAVEYRGPESGSLGATMRLIAWRQANRVSPQAGNTYGLHYSDPSQGAAEDYRLDVCVSFAGAITDNPQGVIEKWIPGGRCAQARHLGSRDYIPVADWLYREWLPRSGEQLRDCPLIFHYVNVGPDVVDSEMITDVYLPLL